MTQYIETAPIWRQLSPGREPNKPLTGSHRSDVVVIGAGIAGLAAAYFVATHMPQTTVTVLDAEELGAGTTARSTGIVTPGMKIPLDRCRRAFGDVRTRAAFQATLDAVELLEQLVRTESLDCDLRREPHVRVALTDRHVGIIDSRVRQLRQLGFDARMLAGADLADLAGDGYLAGQLFGTALLIDPYRFVVHLAGALTRLGVRVHEHSRVRSIDTHDDITTVTTDGGQIQGQTVLLAMNGYAGPLNPYASAVVPVRSHALATVPLTPRQRSQLGWQGRGAVIDERHFFNHYRLTHDGRLLFGGGPISTPARHNHRNTVASAHAYDRLQLELARRFPALSGVPIAARWSALEATSFDRLAMVGPIPGQPGIHHSGSWSGHGLAAAVAAGHQFARHLAGEPVLDVPWNRSSALKIPGRSIRQSTLKTYLKILDSADRVDARRSPSRPPTARRAGR